MWFVLSFLKHFRQKFATCQFLSMCLFVCFLVREPPKKKMANFGLGPKCQGEFGTHRASSKYFSIFFVCFCITQEMFPSLHSFVFFVAHSLTSRLELGHVCNTRKKAVKIFHTSQSLGSLLSFLK